MMGIKRCDRCWELETRVRQDMDLVWRILATPAEDAQKNWDNDFIQFSRLIAELETVGAFTPDVVSQLCEEMDLLAEDIAFVITRAQDNWEFVKSKTHAATT